MGKDFSRPSGPRLRISLGRYEPRTRNFKAVKNASALVNVADAQEQRRLWQRIEDTIADEKGWRNERADSRADSLATAASALP